MNLFFCHANDHLLWLPEFQILLMINDIKLLDNSLCKEYSYCHHHVNNLNDAYATSVCVLVFWYNVNPKRSSVPIHGPPYQRILTVL